LAKAMFGPGRWGVRARKWGWFWCVRDQRLVGHWPGAGLAVGVGNRLERSGAMGVRRSWAPGMSIDGLAGRLSGRASVWASRASERAAG
jgi:hypothetical protein